jgi:hypothetical protein
MGRRNRRRFLDKINKINGIGGRETGDCSSLE